MTVVEFQARKIERMAESLAHFIRTTRDDRLTWSAPGEEGSQARTVLEQASECVVVNRLFAALLRGEEVDVPAARNNPPQYADAKSAGTELMESARELAAAVRAMSDADLEKTYAHWRGPSRGEVVIEAGYRNMAYHAGQINFIQVLYGDSEFHVPPSWM